MRSVITIFLLLSTTAFAQLESNIITSKEDSLFNSLKSISNKLSFNYYIKYLGPSLSGDMQEGSTFNRFETGQDYKGDELDFKSSIQTFQSLRLGYSFDNGYVASYSISYQDNLNENIEYNEGVRDYGRTFNNHRAGIWVPSLIKNNLFFINSAFFYELPTTDISRENGMQYGLGFQPQVGFFLANPAFSLGLATSIERDFYPDNEFLPSWCSEEGYTCDGVYPIKRQVLRVSVAPYLNYSITDKFSVRSQLTFDWDQDGDQIGTNDFNKNLDDIYTLGASYAIFSSVLISGGIEGSLTVLNIDRTAMFASLGLSI